VFIGGIQKLDLMWFLFL